MYGATVSTDSETGSHCEVKVKDGLAACIGPLSLQTPIHHHCEDRARGEVLLRVSDHCLYRLRDSHCEDKVKDDLTACIGPLSLQTLRQSL